MERRKWLFAGVISACHTVQHVYLRLLPPLIPLLAVDLGFPLWKLGLLVGARSAADGLGQTPMGVLSDSHDRRLLLSGGVAVLVAGVGSSTVHPTGYPLITANISGAYKGRAIGIWGSSAGLWGLNPARDALISEITPEEREGRTFGYLWTGTLLLGAIAPIVVGYIGDVASLRDGFQLLAAITAVSVVPIVVLYSDRVYVNVDDYRAEEK
jgi:MFS family permease